MVQREVTDKHNTPWTCVQAYTGLSEKLAVKATDLVEGEAGKVTVVCTPTGGAKTKRLELDGDWETQLSDEDLVDAIENQPE